MRPSRLLLVGALLVGTAGCGGSARPDAPEEPTPEAKVERKLLAWTRANLRLAPATARDAQVRCPRQDGDPPGRPVVVCTLVLRPQVDGEVLRVGFGWDRTRDAPEHPHGVIDTEFLRREGRGLSGLGRRTLGACFVPQLQVGVTDRVFSCDATGSDGERRVVALRVASKLGRVVVDRRATAAL